MKTPKWEYVPSRPSDLDRACLAAGPTFAVVADAERLLGIVRAPKSGESFPSETSGERSDEA